MTVGEPKVRAFQRGVPFGMRPAEEPDIDVQPLSGPLFRAFRLWHQRTQQAMADALGVHLATYMAWENDRRPSALSGRAIRNMLIGLRCQLDGHRAHSTNGEA